MAFQKAFGKVDWNFDAGEWPIFYRSSSMEMSKKSLSYFMPNNHPSWCNGQGNPTKSDVVNKLIVFVRRCEVHKQGAPSKAKRALTQAEFRKEMELLRKHKDNFDHQVTFRSLGLYQYHLIGRVDDAANFEIKDPKRHDK